MSLDQRVLTAIQALYDAAMDETLWPKALQEMTDLTGSQAATFWVLDSSDQPRLPTLIIHNFDPAFMKAYLDGIVPHDPTVQYLVRHPNCSIVHDGLVITERDKDRHPYYDWHGRHSDTRFRLVGQLRPASAVQAGVALHRTLGVGRYEADDIDRFSILNGHLERALSIGFRLGTLGAMRQSAAELLDRNPAAVLLLDGHKRVIYANRSAEALRSKGDGIRLAGDEILVLHKQDHDRLQGLISQVLSAVTTPGSAPGGIIRAQRPSGKRPYAILVTPVSHQFPVLTVWRPAVCIFITDPEGQTQLPTARIQSAFGLTEAEARLASLLAGGVELRAAAEELNITYGTARTRLAEIFQKTDTRRQGELVKLLLATLAN